MQKVGARHTRSEFQQIQQMHDLSVKLGAVCEGHTPANVEKWLGEGSSDGDDFTKVSVVKVDKRLGLVFGWAIVSKVSGEPYFDTQGDHIPEDAMLKAAADFMVSSRVAKEMHTGEQVGDVVFAFPLTEDIAKAMGVASAMSGLMIAMKPGPDILSKYASGEYSGFSIGGRRVVDEHVD